MKLLQSLILMTSVLQAGSLAAHGNQNNHTHNGNQGRHHAPVNTPIVAPEMIPGSSHGHYRQKLPYGQGYRVGHGVNGPMGDIIIMSPAPQTGYGSSARSGPQPRAPISPPRHHPYGQPKRNNRG